MDCELMCYDWGREHGIDVMSCIPEHAVGPLLCEAHDTTYQHLLGSILLGQFNESHRWGITDVRDCAEGYRLIAESETVKTGDRFFTITPMEAGGYPNPFEMVEMLRALYPDEPNIGGAMLDAAGNTIEPKEPDEYLLVESTKAQDELGLVRIATRFFILLSRY